MKKLLVISVLSLAVVFSASAQHFVHGGGGVRYHAAPRVFIGGGWGFYSPFYYNPYWAYPPYGYGYYRPTSRLDMQISDIKYDYSEKMALTRQDKSLTHKQRRQKIRELKHERDNAINDAKRNYYYPEKK
jgi:hypothetical protein